MTTKAYLLALVIAGAAFSQTGGSASGPGPVGTFQLLAAPYSLQLKGEPTRNEIFRIDTRTGRAWRYLEGMGEDGTAYVGWTPIGESPFRPTDLSPLK